MYGHDIGGAVRYPTTLTAPVRGTNAAEREFAEREEPSDITACTTEGLATGVLLVAPFMAQADATIANVATPSIHADLGASGAVLELVIGGYLIAFAVLLITGARLGQAHGYRRVFLLGVGLFTLASLLCGLAPGPLLLVLARVFQGQAPR